MLRRNTSTVELNELRNRINKWKDKKMPHKNKDSFQDTNTLKKSQSERCLTNERLAQLQIQHEFREKWNLASNFKKSNQTVNVIEEEEEQYDWEQDHSYQKCMSIFIEKEIDLKNSYIKIFILQQQKNKIKKGFIGKSKWYELTLKRFVYGKSKKNIQQSFWQMLEISKNPEKYINTWFRRIVKKFASTNELTFQTSFWKMKKLTQIFSQKNITLIQHNDNIKNFDKVESAHLRTKPTTNKVDRIEKLYPNTLYSNTIQHMNQFNIHLEEYIKANTKVISSDQNKWFKKTILTMTTSPKVNIQISFWRLRNHKFLKSIPDSHLYQGKKVIKKFVFSDIKTIEQSFWKMKHIAQTPKINLLEDQDNPWYETYLIRNINISKKDLHGSFQVMKFNGIKLYKRKINNQIFTFIKLNYH